MINRITPLSPSNPPNIRAAASSSYIKREAQPTPPTQDEGPKNKRIKLKLGFELEQENSPPNILGLSSPSQFEIRKLTQPGNSSGTIPNIVHPDHINRHGLLLDNEKIHQILNEYKQGKQAINQKLSRKNNDLSLIYSANLVQDGKNSNKAYLVIHYRNTKADSKFYSSKETNRDDHERTRKSGVFAHGGTSNIRIAQNIPVTKIEGTWVLPENYTHYFNARKVSTEQYANLMQDEGGKTRLLGMHPDDFPILDYQQGKKHVVLMPYFPGEELLYLVSDNQIESNQVKLYIIKNILEHLLFIYKKGFIYRDLKLENALFDKKTFQTKIVDFGLAEKPEKIDHTKLVGTPAYMPEELLNANEYHYTLASDIWALGLIIKFLLKAIEVDENGDFKYENYFLRTPQGVEYNFQRCVSVKTREEYRKIIGKKDILAEELLNFANFLMDYKKQSELPAENSVEYLELLIIQITNITDKYYKKPEQQPNNTVFANVKTGINSTTDIEQTATQSRCQAPAPRVKACTFP